MIFGKTKLELKVGIFTFVGLIILVIFILSIGGFKTWSLGYDFSVNYQFVNGVKVGAPVRFAGVDIGEVRGVVLEFVPEENRTNVRLDVWVRSNARIPPDSTVWVNTLGLLGEKYVEIIPGKDYANALKDHQSITGIDPLPIHEIFNRAENIMRNLDAGLTKIMNKEGSLGKFIYDDALYNDFEAFAADIRKNPWKLLYKSKEKK
ncbi:MAG: hypothetical protein COV71_00265 [Candidatus Omnitrophica bacterium CG11_big_fil_rev_8_21_14_0_20_41_12]|nr:MAG: hypothetical protein COV71_00265 [Candidatus Omnitrophica bacterium CG11_big_fil_rev_8_21_14_0_20_41_12]